MKILCLTYTCQRDYARALMHAQLLPADWRKVWVVSTADAALAAPAGTEKIVRDFPRGNSLRGGEAIAAMRSLFLDLRTECDLLVKLDSDTALFRPEAFTEPTRAADIDFTYIRRWWKEGRLLCNGCCYAVSRRALDALETFYPEGIPANFKGHEDLIFSAWWTTFNKDLTLCQLDKNKVHWKAQPYFGDDIIAAHYGYFTVMQNRELLEKHKAAAERFRAARNTEHKD